MPEEQNTHNNVWRDENLARVLGGGGVAVMPTDTLYGVVGKAENEEVVNRIYAIRKRNPDKPCIILVGDVSELQTFSIVLSAEQSKKITDYWPGPVSIILDCKEEMYAYLHRGTNTLAFRMPDAEPLRELLLSVGPLVAPSANPEGLAPAENILQAKTYFGDSVDLYVDGGELGGKASMVVKLHKDGSVNILRR